MCLRLRFVGLLWKIKAYQAGYSKIIPFEFERSEYIKGIVLNVLNECIDKEYITMGI